MTSVEAEARVDAEGDVDVDVGASRETRLERAGKRARVKAKFVRDLLEFGIVVGALSFFLPAVAWIVGIVWGLGLAGDLVKKVIEPELRRRWVAREVERELRSAVPSQRRRLEEQTARRLETLSAEVAHEIRNPITAAKSLVQQMGEDPASGENVDYARVALAELDRVEKSISHLLRFAREEESHMAPLRLDDVVASALAALDERIREHKVLVHVQCEGPLPCVGDAEQLRRVVLNLVGNAIDAVAQASEREPQVRVEAGKSLSGAAVWLRVRDNGPGIAEAQLERIWSPFYTSKASGTGLGLAVTKKIVDAHDGSIEVQSAPGRTEFVVTLPRSRAGEGS